MVKTILIVDDTKLDQRLISDYLTDNGFRTVLAGNGREGLFVARHEKPDLIVLDVMMPEMDGFGFMQLFRKEYDTPVIMLTAKTEEVHRLMAFELGVDDYVTKPFSLAELIARIRAVLRRVSDNRPNADVLRMGDVLLDKQSRQVTAGTRKVELTASEFDLLSVLMAAPGQVFSRLDLLERIKGTAFENAERTVDVHIRNIRSKLESDPSNPRYILTVFGVGYRFNSDVESTN